MSTSVDYREFEQAREALESLLATENPEGEEPVRTLAMTKAEFAIKVLELDESTFFKVVSRLADLNPAAPLEMPNSIRRFYAARSPGAAGMDKFLESLRERFEALQKRRHLAQQQAIELRLQAFDAAKGCIKGGPSDLSHNPKYLEDFGS